MDMIFTNFFKISAPLYGSADSLSAKIIKFTESGEAKSFK